jgi:hypothetical protein
MRPRADLPALRLSGIDKYTAGALSSSANAIGATPGTCWSTELGHPRSPMTLTASARSSTGRQTSRPRFTAYEQRQSVPDQPQFQED